MRHMQHTLLMRVLPHVDLPSFFLDFLNMALILALLVSHLVVLNAFGQNEFALLTHHNIARSSSISLL